MVTGIQEKICGVSAPVQSIIPWLKTYWLNLIKMFRMLELCAYVGVDNIGVDNS